MRTIIAGCVLLLIGGAAARAQTYDGDGYPAPPPPYEDGYGHRPPPPYDGYGRRPSPDRYGEDFDRPPPPPRHHRRCRIVEDFDGPHRVCRPDF